MTASDAIRFPVLLVIAVSGLAWAPPAHAADVPEKTESEMCGGQVTRLRGADLVKALTGVQIRNAMELGVCPDGIRIITWSLELQPDGRYVLELDRGVRRYGRYSFKDDQLCVDLAPNCANFYCDGAGRIYMFGPPNPDNVPTMLNHMKIAGN